MPDEQYAYLSARIIAEEQCVRTASCDAAASVHRSLAKAYRLRLRAFAHNQLKRVTSLRPDGPSAVPSVGPWRQAPHGGADMTRGPATAGSAPLPVSREPSARLDGTRLLRSRYLSQEGRHALRASVAWSRTLCANTDLVRPREQADQLLFVVSGWAYRYICTRGGGRQIPAFLVPGDIANIDSLLLREIETGVKTLTPVTVVAINCDRMLSLTEKHPGIARALTALALVENAALNNTALSLGRRSASARLAHLFCELMVRSGCTGAKMVSFALPLTQEHLGDALGLTPVHVNRMMQELRGKKLIQMSNRMMTIPDVTALRFFAGFNPAYLHMDQ